MSAPTKPQPQPDRDSAPYWEAAREGRLSLQRCNGCSTWRWPARTICNRCHSFESAWTEMSGLATVASWVVNHQNFSPAFRDETPYVVVTVRLDEQDDVRMIGRYLGSGEPSPGEPVEAVFTQTDGQTLINWRPTSDRGQGVAS